MKNSRIEKCPKCGGNVLGEGKHAGHATLYPVGKASFGSEIIYTICTDCGYIIEGYVKKPKKFKSDY